MTNSAEKDALPMTDMRITHSHAEDLLEKIVYIEDLDTLLGLLDREGDGDVRLRSSEPAEVELQTLVLQFNIPFTEVPSATSPGGDHA